MDFPRERFPDATTVRAALALAGCAPSAGNAQPWRWRVRDRAIDLHAAGSEADCGVDCGVVLHHLRVALAAFGWAATTHRLPDSTRVATVQVEPAAPGHAEVMLAAAITRRRTDRGPYSSRPVDAARLAELCAAARREGVVATTVAAILDLRTAPRGDPGGGRYGDLVTRRIATRPRPGGAVIALGAVSGDRFARVRVGEAASAVLLAATTARLSTCVVTGPLPGAVLGDGVVPHLFVRVGLPEPGSPTPPAGPRRPLDELLLAP